MPISDEYERVSTDKITVNREKRQRRVIVTADLEPSIKARGVLQPIIVDRNYVLVAGERRLATSIKVGIPDIPIRFIDSLDPIEMQAIELEENIKRTALPWRDEMMAYGALHSLFLAVNPDWTQDATAKEIGVSPSLVSHQLRVFHDADNPRIANCTGLNEAYNMLVRLDERRLSDVMSNIFDAGAAVFSEAPQDAPPVHQKGIIPAQQNRPFIPASSKFPESIFNLDFIEWSEGYRGPKFNFIHCDFPYGINVFAAEQSGKNRQSIYQDNPDDYWNLITAFCKNRGNFLSHSAHIMFWFSMDYYSETLEMFRTLAPDLEFQKHPLYWTKTDNVGILPDAQRGPRRIVETAFIGSREDRKIVRAKSNWYGAPTDKTFHTSTKPEPMLRNFFEMFIDEQSVVLDPTCGSGASLRAAESLGAKFVLGIERDKEHFDAAQTALKQFRLKRLASKTVEG